MKRLPIPYQYDPSIHNFGTWANDIDDSPLVKVEWAGEFSARGLRSVFHRIDATQAYSDLAYRLQVWKRNDGRVLARASVDGVGFKLRRPTYFIDSYEVFGYEQVEYPKQDERWVPWELRDFYIGWALRAELNGIHDKRQCSDQSASSGR